MQNQTGKKVTSALLSKYEVAFWEHKSFIKW